MRVLVTGANGFIGRALCECLNQHGFAVRRALRRASEGLSDDEVVVGELSADTNWQAALSKVDLVAHLAGLVHVMSDPEAHPMTEFRRVNVQGTRRLAQAAAAAGVRRLVFLSSVKVNGGAASRAYTEADTPHPEDRYGMSKWEAEEALGEVGEQTGLEWVVLRAPLVYGPGVGANFLRLMRAVAQHRPLPFGAVHNRRSLVFLGNLVDAVRVCLTHSQAANMKFLVRDGEDMSTPDLIRRMAHALGVSPALLPVPMPLIQLAGKLTGRDAVIGRLVGSLQVDDAKLRTQLGWRPPYTVDQGLAETARWYRSLSRPPAARAV